MRRGEFVAFAVGAGVAVWPLVSFAQQLKIPTIVVLVVADPGSDRF